MRYGCEEANEHRKLKNQFIRTIGVCTIGAIVLLYQSHRVSCASCIGSRVALAGNVRFWHMPLFAEAGRKENQMAIRLVAVPECDKCGEIWLPDKQLPSGKLNPARERPELCKRCGKCKSPRWNYKERSALRKVKKKVEEKGETPMDEWIG